MNRLTGRDSTGQANITINNFASLDKNDFSCHSDENGLELLQKVLNRLAD